MGNTYRDIYELEPESVADQVIGKNGSALQSCVCPFLGAGVGNVESRDTDGKNLVPGLWDRSFHGVLIRIGQNGRHGERARANSIDGAEEEEVCRLAL